MRQIKRIFVHCTASSQKATVQSILAVFKQKKWKNPGYHYLIEANGKITQLLDEAKVSNGVYIPGQSYNSTSINVAYIGGIDSNGKGIDNRTDEQKKSLRSLLKMLKKKYPSAMIMGHRDVSPDTNHNGKVDKNEWVKMCPCFDAIQEYSDI